MASRTRFTWRRAPRLALLSVVVLLGLPTALPAQDAARIGVAAPLSGEIAELGEGIRRGAQLAAEEINAAGGVRVRDRTLRLEVVAVDDRADAAVAVDVAMQLVEQGVVAVVGHLNSGSSIQAAAVYDAARVAQVSPASANPQLTRLGYLTVNRVVGNDRRQGEIMALYAVQRLKVGTVAVITDDTEYGDVLARAFSNTAELLGARIVFSGAIPRGSANIPAALATVKAMNPGAVYFGGMADEAAEIAAALRGLGFRDPLLAGDGACVEEFITAAKAGAANMHCTVGEPGVQHLPQGRAFAARYRKRFGAEPGVYAPYAYDAVQAIAQAMRNTGSSEAPIVAEAVRDVTVQGVTGPIAFDRNGDLADAPFSVFRTDGSRLVFVRTLR